MTVDKTEVGELLPVRIQGRGKGKVLLLKHAWIKPNAIGGEFRCAGKLIHADTRQNTRPYDWSLQESL
jgi:hypothetical protein